MPQKHSLNKIFLQLPDNLSLWKKSSTFEIYGPKNLFDYINGGAELYLSYGFKQLLSCKYKGKDHPDIIIDLFDMGNSYQAFGVFSHSRETVDDSIGQGCEYGGGLLIFWKGKFYVSILAYPETEAARRAILHIGREIASIIGEKGQFPPILKLMPQEDLVQESIRYFNHYIWLNSHYFISNDNILHIDRHTEAVLAQYKKGLGKYFMLLVVYPDIEKAQKAYSDFRKYYLKDSANRWAGCQIRSKRLWLVFNAGSKKEIDDIFGRLLVE
jgi:hypothetical protein